MDREPFHLFTLYDENTQAFTFYFENAQMVVIPTYDLAEARRMLKTQQMAPIEQETPPPPPASRMEIEDMQKMEPSNLENDTKMRPLYLPCQLMNKFVVCTDIFQTPEVQSYLSLSAGLYVCGNVHDNYYFSNVLGLSVVESLSDITTIHKGTHIFVVNPTKPQSKGLSVMYTIPPMHREIAFAPYFVQSYSTLNVNVGAGPPLTADAVYKNNGVPTWGVNYEISPEDSLKLVVYLMVRDSPVFIHARLFAYIKTHLSRYREFVPRITIKGASCYSNESHIPVDTITSRTGFLLYQR
ncbi:MAG: hypothetical protein MUO31_07565 [Thermodesulfovibrionales bacterium]|nr:hypothetical protein [Thermodesulfovibrionales bacterium]